jgi:hypothetical protein
MKIGILRRPAVEVCNVINDGHLFLSLMADGGIDAFEAINKTGG